ncbi:MAG: PPC domain-containing DNA-binding protein [Candidatus Bipolaricaulaceae bacterium]
MLKAKSGANLVVRLQDGEKLPDALRDLGAFGMVACGVGMLRDLVFGFWDGKRYREERVSEPVELLSLQGNIGEGPEGVVVHLHVVVGREGGAALGGHLLSATVHNTAEILVVEVPGVRLRRRPEPTGLLGLYPEGVEGGGAPG